MYHRHVNRNVGLNPVARSVARKILHDALRDQKIKLYLMDEGEECYEICEGIGMTLAVIGAASEMDKKIGPHSSSVKILRGGLSACQQMMHTGKWQKLNTVAIATALDAAEILNKQVKPDLINKAWHQLTKAHP